jgi:hypothetical protein
MTLISRSDVKNHLSTRSGRKILASRSGTQPNEIGYSEDGLRPGEKPLKEKAVEDSGQRPSCETSVLPKEASATHSLVTDSAIASGPQG